MIVGMDKNGIAGELAFCRNKKDVEKRDLKEGLHGTIGRHLFGMESLMCRYWFPGQPRQQPPGEGPLLILVTRKLHELMNPRVISSGWRIGEVKQLEVRKNGIPVGKYDYAFARPDRDPGFTSSR